MGFADVCAHPRAVCVATSALMNGEHHPYRGKLDWCIDCGAFRAVSSANGEATPWLRARSTDVELLYSRFKRRQREVAA